MTESFQQQDTYVIDDLETLKVLSDPLRIGILEAMLNRPTTVKQAAAELGVPPKKLYYHVNLLEERGLIVVVEEHVVSGIIEKRYQANARNYKVERSLLAVEEGRDQTWDLLLSSIFEQTREEIVRSVRKGMIQFRENDQPVEMLLIRNKLRLTPEQYKELKERLQSILDAYSPKKDGALDDEGDEGKDPYAVVIALYPFARPGEGEESEASVD